MTVSLVLEKNFSKESKLNLLLSAGGENESNFSNLQTTSSEQVPELLGNLLNRFDGNEKQRLYQAKMDFEMKVGKFGKIQTGTKMDFIRYDLLQKVDFLADSVSIPDNDFEVSQRKLGFYLLNENDLGRLTYSYGLRLEVFGSEGFQKSNQEKTEQEIRKLFPFLQLQYSSEKQNAQLLVSAIPKELTD